MKRTLPFISSAEELKEFQIYLSDSEYEKALKIFQTKARTPVVGKFSNEITNEKVKSANIRLKCLREQLSTL